MKKLSIITINYNNLEGLKRTVESVVNQTWQEFEYIVIDGGSADGSGAYLESQVAYLDYWISEKDLGIYNAMNKGIVKATGEYVLFLNSGDHLYSNQVLENNIGYLDNFDLISLDMNSILENDVKRVSMPETLTFAYFYQGGTLCHPSTFIRRELFSTISFYDENLRIVSDWKWFIKALFKHNVSYTAINNILSVFYADGISSLKEFKQLKKSEIEQVFTNDFAYYCNDMKELFLLKRIIRNLRKSRKIKWLIGLRLLDKF